MPPRQDISARSFDRSMRPRHGEGSDGLKRRGQPNTNDQEDEGGHVVAFPRPDERSLAPNTLLLSASGDGQNPTLTEQEGLLQRIHQLQFVEQQRLRALNQHLMLTRHQGLATGQIDPRLSVLGAPTFLGGHPTSPPLTSSEAAVAALFARRRIEREDEIMFNRQLVAMDATRWEQLVVGRTLPSNRTTSSSTGGDSGSELGGVPNIRINERGLLLSGYYASILEATRRGSMPNLTGPTASAHLHRSSLPLPLPHGSLTLEMSRAPIVERHGPLTPEMSQSSVSERCNRSGSTKTNPANNDEKSTASPKSIIGHLIERYTSGGTKEASFPLKLHAILANPEYQDCICWLPHGRSWRIILMSKFETEVIPHHFRHTKYASFMRQVNGWEFSRNPLEGNSYSHTLFVRDDPVRCLKMVRFGATKNAAGLSVKPREKAKGMTEVQEPKDGGPTGKGRHKK